MSYSVELCRRLQEEFRQAHLERPMRVRRYEAADELTIDVTGVPGPDVARVRLVVERFVGGGFAGQVYQVKLLEIEAGPVEALHVGGIYAMKIFVPPSASRRLFRNFLYAIGFQGPFQLQVNPAAARAAALWQKLVRRAARTRFGDERVVADIHATFIDHNIGSCGELGEWVNGRTWRLEVDEYLDLLKLWRKGKLVEHELLGSAEYRAKKQFMSRFVDMLGEMGAFELARQYEWSTCKSQPNCLKRSDSEPDTSPDLVAVDFRAGLALLPFLPMSPGDFRLIWRGIKRGSLVQFDRGRIGRLRQFMQDEAQEFSDLQGAFEQLKAAEQIYRDSIPDITHNHVRLLFSGRLWKTMLDSAVTGWKVRNLVNSDWEQRLRSNHIQTVLFRLLGVLAGLGTLLRRIWARPDWRRHYGRLLTSRNYFKRAMHGRIAEKLIDWHRAGRVDSSRADIIVKSWPAFLGHLPLSILPAGLHRLLTDRQFCRAKLYYIFVRPIKLYFSAALREQWLQQMVADGRNKHILNDEDARTILGQMHDPYVQKYLKSLAVHICTLPVTEVVAFPAAAVYILMHPELTLSQALAWAGAIIAAFQVIPVSPGSLVRGLYVVYLVRKEKNFKDYNIAVFLAFLKYIGYLAFPIQMTYRYPALARFMAVHWATDAVHIVPVFGERGALLEHWVFDLFYNRPLTIRRRMRERAEYRAMLKPRYWHLGVLSVAAAAGFLIADLSYLRDFARPAGLSDVWWLAVCVPLICGAGVTLGCGGAPLLRRIAAAGLCGAAAGVLSGLGLLILNPANEAAAVHQLVQTCFWRVLVFAIFAVIGALITELRLPSPRFQRS